MFTAASIQPSQGYSASTNDTKPPLTRQSATTEAARISDAVAISDDAKTRATTPDTPITEPLKQPSWISKAAHSNPILAEQFAHELAKRPDQPLLDISGLENGTGPIRYTGTGQPVTEESKAYFETEAARIASERMALYQTEKANGTPAAEIVDKLIAYMDKQPKRYLNMMPWRPYGPTTYGSAG